MQEKEIILSDPQCDILESKSQLNLFMAGVGSGKSHLGGIISSQYIKDYPEIKGFIAANTYEQLNTAILTRIFEIWRENFNLIEDVHYVVDKQPPNNFKTFHQFKSYKNIISFINGASIFTGPLDNAKAHDGKEFGWAILDETKDSKEDDVKDVILSRLRQKGIIVDGEPFNPLYILTSPAKVQWINEWFKLDEHLEEITSLIFSDKTYFKRKFDNKFVTISSTYHNLRNLPSNYIELKSFDYNDGKLKKLIYGYPFSKAGGEFIKEFNRLAHVKEIYPKEGLPVHISCDQNVVPYPAMICSQIENTGDTLEVRIFDEICLPDPRNKTEHVCNELIKRHKKYLDSGLFYYGDVSGNKRNTVSTFNDYKILEKVLRIYLNNKSKRINRSNPNVVNSRDLLDNCFAEKYKIRIIISHKCKELIADLEYCKEDENGNMLKDKIKDKSTGQTYEPRGHCLDCLRYQFFYLFKKLIK